MKYNKVTRYWKPLLSLVFGIAAFTFWRWDYPFALTYHEQFQLFLFDSDYLVSHLTQPGGWACYIGEFLVQFYNNVTAGAAILASIFVAMQALTWLLAKKQNRDLSDAYYLLSFLPPVILWIAMGDENVMAAFMVAILLQQALLLLLPNSTVWRILFCFIGIPLCYWLLGPAVLILAVYAGMVPLPDNTSKWKQAGLCVGTILYTVGCIAASALVANYPLAQLFYGIYYYRLPDIFPYLTLLIGLATALLPFVLKRLPSVQGKKAVYSNAGTSIVLFLSFLLSKPLMYDDKKYDLIEYDYLARQEKWDEIIMKSEQKSPDLPMSVSMTNLALGMTNQLGDRLFEFFQNGGEGLVPHFERNHFTALTSSEIFYHLGLTNTAMRFAFEAQEAIPNYNKSVRCMKRLAETNMINGQYAVARKYLRLLQKTLCYSKWADYMMTLINNPQQIDQHPEYGYMRSCHLDQDFLYSDSEVDKMLGQLFLKNKKNALAMQYMAVYPLLERDLDKLMLYLPYVENYEVYNPKAIQEGVAMACMTKHQQPPQGFIDQMTQQNFQNFAQTYAQQGKNVANMQAFRNTFWYYMMQAKQD